MIIMRLLLGSGVLAVGLAAATAVPATASDIKPNVTGSFTGASGFLVGNNTMAPIDAPIQLPGNGFAVGGIATGGDAD